MSNLGYVNVKHGTDSNRRFSSGNTQPLTALPNSLSAFAPQTNGGNGTWFYHPKDRSIEGIRLTHQPSPWVGDFSHFCFMPQSGDTPFIDAERRWSGFRPQDAELHPHYLHINFLRYKADFFLAPTDSGAVMSIEYEKAPRFAVLPFDFEGEIRIDSKSRTVKGYTTSKTFVPKRDDFKIYFIFQFDCGFDFKNSFFTKPDGSTVSASEQPFKGKGAGVNLTLLSSKVCVRLATSYIGYGQAETNLSKESKTFLQAKENAEKIWDSVLSKIEIEAEEEQKRLFYSCLYRAFLYPTKFYETDKEGKNLHINPETNEIKEGVMYTNNGFWDTYRTVYPLYSLIAPKKYAEIAEGYLNFYDDTGYLPRWPSPSEFGCMPGTLIEPVLADAVIKGILNKEQAKRALAAMLKNAEVQSQNPVQGRKSIAEYQKYGYVPNDSEKESVNETLDCAYGDYCIARVAEVLGEREIAKRFYKSSKNYANLFDSESGLMRGKDKSGQRKKDFHPCDWGGEYTEGSAWQNSFAVPHDFEGLSNLYGGKKKLIQKIDGLFAEKPDYRTGGYGFEIHEMTEFAAVDFGQCAISNQPSFHFPYIFSELGDPQKSNYWVNKLLKGAFTAQDDGFPGDEDNGTMACWVIFSMLGFYPFCPGRGDYTGSGTLVQKAVITLENNKKIILKKGDLCVSKIGHSELLEKGE